MKKTIIVIWLMLLLFVIGALFWYNEWVYQLPTPVPKNYKTVNLGQVIELSESLKESNNKPLFLHFFNPDCPCSRFNIKNFKSLVAQYSSKVNFVVVVMSHKTFTVNSIQDKFNLAIPILFDTSIAPSCGVYSTPQAVLIDTGHKLYYRGNYNRSRYCTDEKTNYAKIAITGLLNEHTKLAFSQFALKAYGCQLPDCTQ